MTIDEKTKEVLSSLQINDEAKTVTITSQLDRKQYQTVNELLETAGGKWSRKDKAHVFTVSPSQALKVFLNPDTKTVTTNVETAYEKKKEHQAFFTPDKLADMLVEVAECCLPYAEPERILEPSAGNGQIVKAIKRKWKTVKVAACEIQEQYHQELKALGVSVVAGDFLTYQPKGKYDLVIANPPFAKHQDIAHVRHAFDMVLDGGALVAITSNHWRYASHKVDKEFREWLESLEAEVTDIEAGEFKESGTMVSSNYIVMRK